MRTKTAAVADRMLDAAARLFAAKHFHEVRMEDIAAEAGVGKGTLYRYFNDKDELYLALLVRSSREFLGRLEEEAEQATGPRGKLLRIITAIVSFFDERPHLFDLIQRAEVLQGPGFPWRETRLELIRIVTGLFKEGQSRGDFAVRDPELTALLLLGGLRTVIRFGKKPRPRDYAEEIMAVFLPPRLVKNRKGRATHINAAR